MKKLPKTIRATYSAIPWKSIAGLRDVIIHDDDSTEIPRIWNIVEQDVPALQRAVDQMLEETKGSAEQ